MEPENDQNEDNRKEDLTDDKAVRETTATGTTVTPRRGLRERGAGRQKPGVPASTDVNGAAPSSGRVLRDRSTRAVPAWLKDSKSDDDEETSQDTGGNKRRKVAYSRRKKNIDSSGSTEIGEVVGDIIQAKDSGDIKKLATAQAPPSRRPQPITRARAPSAKTARGPAKPVCKSEPDTENPAVEGELKASKRSTNGMGKKKDSNVTFEDEGPAFKDDRKDLDYHPHTLSGTEEEEYSSSEEDVPFTDDLNDQSYDPKAEKDVPKPKRRAPLRQKEKEVAEIKTEGGEGVEKMEEVKVEEQMGEDQDGPRKRGRRRKDDKTPRLPKRRKKPPVQYVRCEMEGCGTVLAHPRYLQHHIKYQHLLKKKYVCPHPSCGRLFRLQKQLLRHAKHHTDQRDYICEFCARAFKSSHNLAVHRMIHTGEKPLQCEICGFTCRQKASLNWHMKKHDADATYQFSCSICGKKFEKKDCVVAHKAKSHPEVLIAEALAANAGALITTPASLLEHQAMPVQTEASSQEVAPVGQAGQMSALCHVEPVGQQVTQMGQVAQQVSHQVVLLGQDQSLHTMQVPVTIALSPIDPPSPADNQQQTHLQLQMPLQFVQAAQQSQQQPQIQQLTLHPSSVVSQSQLQQVPLQSYSSQQQQGQGQTQILHMTFQPVTQSQTHVQQIPILATPQQLHPLQTATPSPPLSSQPQDPTPNSEETYVLDTSVLSSSSPPSANALSQQSEATREAGVMWEQTGAGHVLTVGTEQHSTTQVQQALI